MKVLFFGVYDLNDSTAARTRIFLKGLKELGIEVIECNSEIRSFKRYVVLFKKYIKINKDYDIMFAAYPGAQLVMPIARILAFFSRKKIVIDPIISLYDTMVCDRGILGGRGLKAAYYYFLDWFSGVASDLIIFDTNENINYFSKTFHIKKEKFKRIFYRRGRRCNEAAEHSARRGKYEQKIHGPFSRIFYSSSRSRVYCESGKNFRE